MQLKQALIQQIHGIVASAKERAIRSVDTERVLMYLNYTEPKKVLDVLRMLCLGKKVPLQEPSELVRQETKDYYVMDEYSQLLKSSIESIMGIEKQKRIDSLFKSGGTVADKEQFKGMVDFKLVTFVIVR